MGRALAAQRRDFPNLDEEEVFILETCMQLHEELGYASVPVEPLPDREEAVANIVSSLVQDTQAFASGTPQLSSSGVTLPESSRHFMHLHEPSSAFEIPVLKEQPTLQQPSDSTEMQWPQQWAPPSVAFTTQSPWSAEFPTLSTTSGIPSGQHKQAGYYETGFVSFAPSAGEIGLFPQDWNPHGSSLFPEFESSALHQRQDFISVEGREHARLHQAEGNEWDLAPMEMRSARFERRLRKPKRRQEEGIGVRQATEMQAGSHLVGESALPLPQAIDPEPNTSGWAQREASFSSQFRPTLFQLLGRRGALGEESSEEEDGLAVSPAKKMRKLGPRQPDREAAGLSEADQPQTSPESSADYPSSSITQSRGAKAGASAVELQRAVRSSSETSISGDTSEESGKTSGSSTSSTWESDLVLWFPFPPTLSRDAPGHVTFKLRSGVVVRIPHPPEPSPPNTHPFYKIPLVQHRAIDCEFSVERAFSSRDCKTVVSRLYRFQKLLMKSELGKHEVDYLVHLVEDIVRYLFRRHRRPLLAEVPSQASQRLGVRLLCFDAVVVSLQLVGHAMSPQNWFPRLVDAVPVDYRKPFALDAPKTRKQALLAFRLSKALRLLTRGQRPPMEELVRLKQELFNPSTAPIMFLRAEWDPWRIADEAHQNQ
ncbi:hypothetical protein Emag_003390 [Eimeria magna]